MEYSQYVSDIFLPPQYFEPDNGLRVIDEIDKYVIAKVKEKRTERGISQSKLAFELGVSNSFIGMVESSRFQHKYSISQLNQIAFLLDCSPRDFLPEKALPSK